MTIEYPVRCQIIDVFGVVVGNFQYKTPEVSKPHIGKYGLAEEIEGKVKITLDDGNIIYGYECWWMPIKKGDRKD